MHYGFKFYVLFVLFLVGILLSPTALAIQNPSATIPNLLSTSIVAAQLNSCPSLVYLPLIARSAGQVAQVSAGLTDAQPQILEQPMPQDARDEYDVPSVLSSELLAKLDEVPVISSTIVFTEATSLWENPSPDPSGIDQFGTNSVIIVDSEADEQDGRTINLWVFDLVTRQVLSSTSTLLNNISSEPVDVAVAEDGMIILADDDRNQIMTTQFDANGVLQQIYTFDTKVYGSLDVEGVDLFVGNDQEHYLVTVDGNGNRVYIHHGGDNRIFEGPCSPGDDNIREFDTVALGILQPKGVFAVPDDDGEGVTYYLVGDPDRQHIYVVHAIGDTAQLVSLIDIGVLSEYHKMSGIVVMPNTQIVLVFSGVDNASDPDENDGVLAVIQPHVSLELE